MKNDFGNALSVCPLFAGLSGERLDRALRFFHASERVCARGEILKKPGDRLSFFGLVLSGNIQVAMDDPDGNHLIMASVGPGQTFGESLCYLGRENPVTIAALSESRILSMDCRSLHREAAADADCRLFAGRFTAMLAERTLLMNDRIQILSKLTIREKLLTLFALQGVQVGRPFTLPMDRETLAAYLGANRSALSRELSAMKAEGLIDYSRSTFRLIPPASVQTGSADRSRLKPAEAGSSACCRPGS